MSATDPMPATHPLDPLSADEIAEAVRILRAEGRMAEGRRLMVLTLAEPTRSALASRPGDAPPPREAFAVVLDNRARTTYEAVVRLDDKRVASWTEVPGA